MKSRKARRQSLRPKHTQADFDQVQHWLDEARSTLDEVDENPTGEKLAEDVRTGAYIDEMEALHHVQSCIDKANEILGVKGKSVGELLRIMDGNYRRGRVSR